MSKLLSIKALINRFNSINSIKTIDFTQKQRISYLLSKLKDRKLIGVNGKDSYDYIQGLVTNDVRHLCPTRQTSVSHDCIYSFMLNTSGRVISDVLVYKYDSHECNENTRHLLIEIDSQLLDSMTKFLNSYKIRRKVEIDIRNEFEVWALFPSLSVAQLDRPLSDNEMTFEPLNSEDLVVVRDPRLKEMGFRLLIRKQNNENQTKDILKTFLNSKSIEFSETNGDNYDKYRYRLGVGEGVKDFPVESCFPLESNGDFLHAISFHKGCYVGQELTARIYHTGVVRKRLLPIELMGDKEVIENLVVQNITTNEGKSVGKFRSNSGANGLALLRFDQTLKADRLLLSETGLQIKCWKPFWWPKEYSKHISSVP